MFERIVKLLRVGTLSDAEHAPRVVALAAARDDAIASAPSLVARDALLDSAAEEEYAAVVDYYRGAAASLVVDKLAAGTYLFSHPVFLHAKKKIADHDASSTTPCVVEDGLYECKRCRGKRTFSVGKQTRSLDEGTTVFVKCAQCSASWTVAG